MRIVIESQRGCLVSPEDLLPSGDQKFPTCWGAGASHLGASARAGPGRRMTLSPIPSAAGLLSLNQPEENPNLSWKAALTFTKAWCDFYDFRQRVPQSSRVESSCQVMFCGMDWTNARPDGVTKSSTRRLEQLIESKNVFLIVFTVLSTQEIVKN